MQTSHGKSGFRLEPTACCYEVTVLCTHSSGPYWVAFRDTVTPYNPRFMLEFLKSTTLQTASVPEPQLSQSRKQYLSNICQTSTLSFLIKYIWSFSPPLPPLSLVCLRVPRASDRDGLLSHSLKVTASPPSPAAAAAATAAPVRASHDVHKWWAEKKMETISMRRNKRGTQDKKREWGCLSAEEFHPEPQRCVAEGEELRWEHREHLSLSAHTFIPCSAWHPTFLWHINHDFSLIDPLSATEGRKVPLVSIPVFLSMLHPTFLLPAVMLNHYQTLLIWNMLDVR